VRPVRQCVLSARLIALRAVRSLVGFALRREVWGSTPNPGRELRPCALTRASPLTRFRCGGGSCAPCSAMRFVRSPHSPSGCSLARGLCAAARNLGFHPRPRQGASPLHPTRASPLTRFRCGGGLCALFGNAFFIRSPHSPSGCSLACWFCATAGGLGFHPKPRQGASPLRPDKGFALDPVPLRRGKFRSVG